MAKDENENVMAEAKAVAVTNVGPSGVMVGGQEFKVVEQVTVPVLKQESGETVAIRITQPIVAEETFDDKSGESKGFINVARVTELGSGQLMNYVFNAISASEIRSAYPNDTYVGKCFAIKKLGVVAGKRYKEVQIIEIEPA